MDKNFFLVQIPYTSTILVTQNRYGWMDNVTRQNHDALYGLVWKPTPTDWIISFARLVYVERVISFISNCINLQSEWTSTNYSRARNFTWKVGSDQLQSGSWTCHSCKTRVSHLMELRYFSPWTRLHIKRTSEEGYKWPLIKSRVIWPLYILVFWHTLNCLNKWCTLHGLVYNDTIA